MNSSTQARLAKCFAAVFPDLDEQEVQSASPTSIAGWDSLASVTLLSVLEEEFNLEIPPEDMEHLLSFELVLAYVINHKQVGSDEERVS